MDELNQCRKDSSIIKEKHINLFERSIVYGLAKIQRDLKYPIACAPEYRKIPKISPGAYIFQRPFLRGLFLEGLIFGGAYLRREICVSKSIGLALQLEVNLPILLCFTLYLRAIFQVQAPGGAYIWRGDLTEGFLRYRVRGLIFGGAYTWRGLFSEFYGILETCYQHSISTYKEKVTFKSNY